jgi:YggT family protein
MNSFLLHLGELYIGLLLLRFYATLANTPIYMMPMQFLVTISEPLTHPFRRFIRNRGLWDITLLLLIIVLEVLLVAGLIFPSLVAAGTFNPLALLVYSLLRLLQTSIVLLLVIVVAEALLSWVNPHAPVAPFLQRLSAPFLEPLRRLISPIGGIDITPLILLLLIQLFLQFILNPFLVRAYLMVMI